MRPALFASLSAALLLGGSPSHAADQNLYSPEKSGFSFELGPGWVEGPSIGEDAHVLLSTAPSPAGYRSSISVRLHRDASPRERRRFVRSKAREGKDKTRVKKVSISGRKAERFQTTSTRPVPREFRVKTKERTIRKSLPERRLALREDTVVVPTEDGFCVLVYSAAAETFDRELPAFERALETFRLR